MAWPEPRAGSTMMWCGDVARAIGGEAELHEQIRNVFLVSLGRRIFLRDRCVEFGFAVLAARAEAAYQTSNGSSGRPSRDSISFATCGTSGELSTCSSIALQPFFGDFAIFIEAAIDQCGRGGRVRIRHARGADTS